MAERVEIFNSALGHIGQGTILAAATDDGPEARECRRYYAMNRDALLAEHPWRFASRNVTLARFTPSPTPFQFAYAKPAGALMVRGVTDAGNQPVDWELGGVTDQIGDETPLILTEAEAAFALITRRIEQEAQFPPLFAEALAWRLAWSISFPITREVGRRRECWEQYLYWRTVAAAQDQNHVGEFNPVGEDFIGARGTPASEYVPAGEFQAARA
jgi:hypothetical protein